jgi:two-component system, OmpR family, phosphate regulon sensor histidine kinase PhoR
MTIENAKILVVDDELGMREGIRRLFSAKGHQVETAATGQEGIEKGTSFEYDLYFLDLKIGDMDGVQVLGAIKARFPEAICIIITAYASIDTAVETTRLGAYHYASKPFAPEEIQLLLERALERRWYTLEARRLREEQKRRLLEVSQEKSRIRTIINAIDDGILVINQQGEVVFFNPRFLSLLDIHQPLAPGQPVLDLLPESLRLQISEIFANRESLKAIKQEIVIHPPARLVIMANTTPILDDQQNVLGAVSVLRDISEMKQVEMLKSQFVNMAAHEMKAPLTAIQGYLEMVLDKTLGDHPDIYQGYLQRSLERSRSLINLINDLLNISRMQAGKIRREIELIDMNALILNTVDFFKNEMAKQQIKCSLELKPGLLVEADKEEMQRVLNNLISNAIKYNRANGSIEIRGSQDGHFIRISVRDSGIGMRQEEKERLFEEFFRAKNSLTRNITGTGLGLTIVKKIIDNYAGKIQVETEFEKGSTFTLFLPTAQRTS